MNKIIFSALLLSGVIVNAQQQQVGINTAEPKATLHVEAGASENKGVIIPRITAAEMKAMTAGLGADHHSMMTYLKEQMPSADRTGKLVDVAESGYYFYDNTTGVQKWKALGGEQDFRKVWLDNYLTKDAGIDGNGTSLGTGDGSIGIGRYTFNGFASRSDLTGRMNIALGRQTYNFQNGAATMSGTNNTGIGEVLYDFQNGGSMQGGRNIAMGDGIYTFQKTNAQFSNTASSNMGIGSRLFNLRNGDLTGWNNIGIGSDIYKLIFGNITGAYNIGLGRGLYNLDSGNMEGINNISIGAHSYFVKNGNITNNAINNIALGNSIYRFDGTIPSTFSGGNNIGIGNSLYSLSGNFTGVGNIGMGYNVFNIPAGDFSGGDNIGIGNSAMQATGGIAGNNNIALGSNPMQTSGKIAGTDNIAIGNHAFWVNNSDISSYNIGIGNWALYDTMGKGNANIQIGNRYIGTPVVGQLNQVVAIGNEINGLTTSNTDSNVILLGKIGSDGPKVGIGTYKPGAKLEVNNGTTAGAVKIVDGTQGAGRVLTSDANGLATWKNVTLFTGTERIGVYHWGVGTALGNTNWNKIASITVPPGASMVYVKIHLLAGGLTSGAARAYVGKKDIGWNNSNTNDTPIGGSALFVTYHGIDPELQTSFIYNNTTNSNETLYLNLQSNQPTAARSGFEYPTGGSYLGTKWVENQFSAIPVN